MMILATVRKSWKRVTEAPAAFAVERTRPAACAESFDKFCDIASFTVSGVTPVPLMSVRAAVEAASEFEISDDTAASTKD